MRHLATAGPVEHSRFVTRVLRLLLLPLLKLKLIYRRWTSSEERERERERVEWTVCLQCKRQK